MSWEEASDLLTLTLQLNQRSISCEDALLLLSHLGSMQALVTALGVSWEEASHLLKHTHGDLTAAFKNELSAYHLNEQLLDELVWEYAACRCVLCYAMLCYAMPR